MSFHGLPSLANWMLTDGTSWGWFHTNPDRGTSLWNRCGASAP